VVPGNQETVGVVFWRGEQPAAAVLLGQDAGVEGDGVSRTQWL
jgi:hypothetical protein